MAETVLDKIRKEQGTAGQNKPDYKAIGEDKSKSRQVRLAIRLKDGSTHIIAYSYIMRMICTSHQFVSLVCTDCIITIEGKNLTGAHEKLQDERVRYLEEFNRARFDMPATGEPFIQSIVIDDSFSNEITKEQ
mgnify:CR=1 FL=1